MGIPDFRVAYAQGMDFKEDLEKAQYLLDRSAQLSLEGLMRLYWSLLPGVTAERAEIFTQRALVLEQKAEASLREIDRLRRTSERAPRGTALEIGCGTGGFILAAKRQYEEVVGMDIGYQWLVIAQKRFEEAGVEAPLFCGGAEHLPFGAHSFDLVVAEDVIEHVQDQAQTVSESARVLSAGGALFMATPNRFSITPEPHVGLLGVGWLPMKWRSAYVERFRDVSYDDIHILSRFELSRLMRENGLPDHRIVLPAIPEEEQRSFSTVKKALVTGYDAARTLPLLRTVLRFVGPFYHVIGFASSAPSGPHA